MRTILLAAILVALAGPAAAADQRRFTVTGFDRVQVDGPFSVTVATGRSPSASASGDRQALERVSVEVEGRVLKVRPDRSAWGGYPGEGPGPVAVAVSTHELRGVSVTGSGSVTVDKARAMRFDVALSGSGKASLGNVEADSLVLGLLGSGRIEIAGKAKTMRATVQGSGDLDAAKLLVEDARLNADTAGKVSLGVRREANVTSTGAGDVDIAGSPACTVKALGSGRVRCGS